MKAIYTYIIEKLIINKETIRINDKGSEFYFKADIDDITEGEITSEEVDNALKNFPLSSWFGPNLRKNIRNDNNKLWYAIYCLLYDDGPRTRDYIIKKLKPNSGSAEYSRLFSEMAKRNIITVGTGKDRGLQFPNPPSEWRN